MSKIAFSVILVFTLLSTGAVHAQGIGPQDMERLKKMEDSLVVSADSMYSAFLADARVGYAERFARQLVRTLKITNSYLYPFDTLKKMINIIYADDNAFKVFNWAILPGNIPKRYYGAIQLPQPQLKLIGLNDCSSQVGAGLEDSIFSKGRWFGALYYRIMGNTVGNRRVYTMFGLNNAGPISNRKVLDAMTFDTTGGVVFGAPIFSIASHANPRTPVNRFVMEYKKSVAATLNWSAENNMIIFDRLVSISNDPTRKYTFVPSGQYDGLVWADGMWRMKRTIMDVTILHDGEAPDE